MACSIARTGSKVAASAVLFDQVGDGPARRDGEQVRTLMIGGARGDFMPSHSDPDGASLVAWHEEIPDPVAVAVRYTMADNPEGANLVNTIGYPACPFRTDRCCVEEYGHR